MTLGSDIFMQQQLAAQKAFTDRHLRSQARQQLGTGFAGISPVLGIKMPEWMQNTSPEKAYKTLREELQAEITEWLKDIR